jgi:putative transposase
MKGSPQEELLTPCVSDDLSTPLSSGTAQPQRPAPPRELEFTPAGTAEFVICDHTMEFHFRDAKQYWGLEDFMHVTPTGVTNAANLSWFMVNVAYHSRADGHPHDSGYSVLDLKADYRGYKYVEETIQMLPEKPEPVLLAKILNQVTSLGRIHAARPAFSFS